MAVRFPCPICRREMFLEPVHEGFEVPCPHCGARFPVPPGIVSVPVAAQGAPGGAPHTGDAAFCGTPLFEARAAADVGALPVPPPRRPPSASDGSLQLVFGILGIVGTIGAPCFFPCFAPLALFAPVAWWFGHKGRASARSQGREPAGSVTAGWVLGIIGTCLIVLGLAATVVFVAFAAMSAK